METYADEMDAGREALARKDWRSAYRHFGRAHELGHDDLRLHLAAHRGLLRTSWRSGRVDRVIGQAVLMAGAALFDRKPRGARA
ncbi:DUF3703 domain-containing protein [Amycolatopsis sp. NPDC059021]|uniref:DUF3703 domain-containing protein n=1 Tax=Amycolatopsis sp. NPDC059021 TaxID=3346704 RepID=UPI00366B47CC